MIPTLHIDVCGTSSIKTTGILSNTWPFLYVVRHTSWFHVLHSLLTLRAVLQNSWFFKKCYIKQKFLFEFCCFRQSTLSYVHFVPFSADNRFYWYLLMIKRRLNDALNAYSLKRAYNKLFLVIILRKIFS